MDTAGVTSARPSLFSLLASFLWLGATAFGGPASLSSIRRLVVQQRAWIDDEEMRSCISLSQAIPGAISMQAAAYIGLRVRGVPGALVSYLGFGMPSFLLMLVLAAFYSTSVSSPRVAAFFDDVQALSVAILAGASWMFGRSIFRTRRHISLALVAVVLFCLGLHPIYVVLLSGLGGMALLRHTHPSASSSMNDAPRNIPTAALLVLVCIMLAGAALLWWRDPVLLQLALLMSKINLVAFGGGFAAVPVMYHEVIDVHHWMNGSTFLTGMVLGQITPGSVIITATFVGYWVHGVAGGIAATFGIFAPSFLMVVAITPVFNRLRVSPLFSRAIEGIASSFVGLLLVLTIRLVPTIHWDPIRIILAAGGTAALILDVKIIWVILGGAVIASYHFFV